MFPLRILFLVCTVGVRLGACKNPTIKTEYGEVFGFTSNKVDVFWGIPFAAPPVGALRFKPPQPHSGYTSPFNATALPPFCVQGKWIQGDPFHKGTEDCLTLDVYTPEGASTKKEKLPVMVWIHGGGNTVDTSHGTLLVPDATDLYDGRNLTRNHNVIIASINYRLGSFGWLALDYLRKEDPQGISGNYGFLDQRMGMKWVKDNIVHFGGDPNKITIFGESAGGTAMCAHWVAPGSKGLFNAIIGESALCSGALSFLPLKVAENFGKLWTQKIGCWSTDSKRTVDCLRKIGIQKLLQPDLLFPQQLPPNTANIPLPTGMPLFPFWTVVDGSSAGIPDRPDKMVSEGKFHDVPVMMGSNTNEGSLFTIIVALAINTTLPFTQEKTEKLLDYLSDHNKTMVNLILAQYPMAHFKDETQRVSRMLTHYLLACTMREMMRKANKYKKEHNIHTPSWLYLFNRKTSSFLGDFHSAEIPYVWENPVGPFSNWNSRQYLLSKQMSAYWTRMARYHDPNKGGTAHPCPECVHWDEYSAYDGHDSTGNKNIMFEDPLKTENGLYEKYCNFWDKIGYDKLPYPV